MPEFWDRDVPKSYRKQNIPTEVESGKLRLVREGEVIRYLVADGPDGDFREIHQLKFGTDELSFMNFEVTDSGSPGNSVDARLVDLKVRSAKLPTPDPVSTPASPSDAVELPQSKGWGVYLLVSMLALLTLGGIGVCLAVRRKRQVSEGSNPEVHGTPHREMIAFVCSSCDRNLKAKTGLAGKKIKCPHCGQLVLIPAAG